MGVRENFFWLFSKKRVGISVTKSLLNRVRYTLTETEPEPDLFAECMLEDDEGQPLQVRVIDKLADILFASDMILDMLKGEQPYLVAGHLTKSVEPSVRRVYEQVNELMKQLAD